MTRIILLRSLLLITALTFQASVAQEPAAIDKVLIERGQVASNGDEQVLNLHITGKSIDESFAWTFTITDSRGNTIYRVAHDDAKMDAFFNDPAYIGSCSGYRDCKRRYYFRELPEAIFQVLDPSRIPWGQDTFDQKNLQDVAERFLKAKGLGCLQITRVLAYMRRILAKPGFHVLEVPQSPVQSEPPMIWVPEVQSFVPFHED